MIVLLNRSGIYYIYVSKSCSWILFWHQYLILLIDIQSLHLKYNFFYSLNTVCNSSRYTIIIRSLDVNLLAFDYLLLAINRYIISSILAKQ